MTCSALLPVLFGSEMTTSGRIISSLLVILVIFPNQGECDRTKQKIYFDVKSIAACFRRLNATHTVGCASSQSGNVGVIHVIESEADLNWIVDSGPHAPYAALMTPSMFIRENVDKLRDSGKINGIIVDFSHNGTQVPAAGFSPDDSCPNRRSGLYAEDANYRDCQNVTWNKDANAMMFEDFGFPIIAVRNETEIKFMKEDCYESFNKPNDTGSAPEYPLCAAQLKDAMSAAKDTPTCIRRSRLTLNLNPVPYCDALGDYNVYALSRSLNNTDGTEVEDKSIIVAAARLDGFSLFDTVYPNVDSPASSVITLLAAAEAFSLMKDQLPEDHRPVMFSFFQGEAFDYIGSGRMVYDLERNQFPWPMKAGEPGPKPIGLQHIRNFLEVSQVGMPSGGKVWTHTDPISMNDDTIKQEVDDLLASLQDLSLSSGITVEDTPQVQPLPPSSVQSFLRKVNISSVVLSDHQTEFTNKYYNSRFDDVSHLDLDYPDDENDTYNYVTPVAEQLSSIATVLARTLYKLSTDNDPPADLKANTTSVANLLYCFLVKPKCPLFREIFDEDDGKRLAEIPYPWYVGVSIEGSTGSNYITRITRQLLARYLGDPLNVTRDRCSKLSESDLVHEYQYMMGPDMEGVCMRSTANLTLARSIAFDIDDYDWNDGEYSTWSESRWETDAFIVRVFLIPSKSREVATVTSGIILLAISLVGSYFLHKRGCLLFRPMHMF